jgi:hypothetical protein
MIIYPYEYIYAHPTPISTFKIPSRLDLNIHEVSHQKRLVVDGDITFY